MNLIDLLLNPITISTVAGVNSVIAASSIQKRKKRTYVKTHEEEVQENWDKLKSERQSDFDSFEIDSEDHLKNKPDSALIMWMIKNSKRKIDIPVLAKYLNCQTQSLRNKLNRNSFSVDDLMITAYACDFSISIKNDSNEDLYAVDPKVYFSAKDSETWERISSLKNTNYAEKKAEYDELKAKLESLDKEYQFSKTDS